MLAQFALWELRNPHPMLDLRFFKRKSFTGGAAAITLVFFGMFGMFFLLTQYLQFVHGWTPLGAGVRLLPFAGTMMIVAPSSARIAERVGTKRTVATGLAIAALGFVLVSRLQPNSSYGFLIVGMCVLALGMALTMPPSTASILSSLPMGKQGVGSAMNDTTRELGGALGVAALGSVFATRYTSALGSLQQLPAAARQAARSSVGGALGVASRMPGATGKAFAAAAKHAFTQGQSTAYLLAAGVVLGASVLIWRIMPVELNYDYQLEDESQVAADLGPLAPLGPPPAEGADEELVDNGQNGGRRGQKAGQGAGSLR